jgi:hypothetical protein
MKNFLKIVLLIFLSVFLFNFKSHGKSFQPENAFQSQALIELKNEFCEKRNCLECMIGQGLVKT